jgi:hypothetical protein
MQKTAKTQFCPDDGDSRSFGMLLFAYYTTATHAMSMYKRDALAWHSHQLSSH